MAGRQAGAQQDCIPGRAPWHSFAEWQGTAGGQGRAGEPWSREIFTNRQAEIIQMPRSQTFSALSTLFSAAVNFCRKKVDAGWGGAGGQATCASAAAPVPRQGTPWGGGRAGVRANARHAICSTAACRVQLTDFLAGTRPNSLKMGHSMQKLSLCVFICVRVCVCVCNC